MDLKDVNDELKKRLEGEKEHFVMFNLKPNCQIVSRTSFRFRRFSAYELLPVTRSHMKANAKVSSFNIVSIICWNMAVNMISQIAICHADIDPMSTDC